MGKNPKTCSKIFTQVITISLVLQSGFGHFAQSQTIQNSLRTLPLNNSIVLNNQFNQYLLSANQYVPLANKILDTLSPELQLQLKNLVAGWFVPEIINDPYSQFGLFKPSISTEGANNFVIRDASELGLSQVETDLLKFLIILQKRNELNPFILGTLQIISEDPVLGPKLANQPSIPADKLQLGLGLLNQIIFSESALSVDGNPNWISIASSLQKVIDGNNFNRVTQIEDSEFVNNLAQIVSANPMSLDNIQLLVDGKNSFDKRRQLIKTAKESINMITWAVLDDKTGDELAKLLIQKVKEKVDVRLVVDGQVSQRPGYKKYVDLMESNGVQVVRWMNPKALFMGQHRKILIIDREHVIAGGMNPGNTYSHLAGKDFWRDTDIYFSGKALKEVNQLFGTIWNSQLNLDKKLANKYQKYDIKTHNFQSKLGSGNAQENNTVQIIDHQPSKENDSHSILLAILKIIRSSQKTLDIENAYVIGFPILLNEIKLAVERGVQVRVLTNSSHSVDEPIVAQPIERTANELHKIGVEVYLRKGTTLHSKFLTADDQIFMIGSYNLHPRSETMESETVFVVNSKQLATEARKQFEIDISSDKAELLQTTIVQKINLNLLLPLRMFFNQL